MPAIQLTLHLISTETRQPLANLRVEAWDKDVRHNDLLGSAVTDSSGRCVIRFDEGHYADSRDPLPDVFFRVYEGERLRHNTEYTPMENLAAGEYSFTLEIGRQDTAAGALVVSGQVLDAFKKPVAGLGVEAWDVDLWQESPLGGTTTDAQGKYSITYTLAQFARAEKDGPDLKVQVKNAAGMTAATSEILYQAPAEAEINFTLEARALGLSEYEQYQTMLLPVLDGRTLAEAPDDKMEFLERETDIPYQHLQYLRQDERDSAPNQLPAAALYGLYRQGLSTNLRRLAAEKPERWSAALKTSLEQNLIPAVLAAQTDFIQQRLREMSLQYAFEMPDAGEEAPIGVVLSGSGLSDSKQRAVAAALQHHEPDPDQDEWESLLERAGLSEPELQAVRFTLETNRLAGGHQPTLRVLQNLRQTRGWTQTRDLARLNRAEWQETVQALTLPEGFTNHAEYAEEMAFRMETVFPTAVYLHRLEEMGDLVNGDTTAFLSANPGFDLLHSAVDTFISGAADLGQVQKADQLRVNQLRNDLKRDQRLARLAPARDKFSVMQELKKQGFDSAQSIAKQGKDSFVQTFSDTISEDVVATMYERALVRSEIVQLTTLSIKDLTTGVTALPSAKGAVTETPEWAALFGTLNSCKCEHCRSVYSPAAYLVDILKFIRDAPTPGLQAELFGRRPELPHILLNCDNANVPLPYIDLVNEVFERYIARDTSAPWPQTVFEEPFGKEKLRAEPKYEREAAYDLLQEAYHPWALPFNLSHEKAKAFAQHIGVPLYEAYEIARFPERNIVKTHLWISEEIYRLITVHTSEEAILARYWGVSNLVQLERVSVLMAQSGLEYEEVDRLIQSALFIHLELEIDRSASPCNYEEQSLSGLSDLYRRRFFDWLHRLLRLQRALGWTFAQFMDVLEALKLVEWREGDSLDDYFDRLDTALETIVLTFSKLIRIAERLRIKVEKAAALNDGAKIARALKMPEKELASLSGLTGIDIPVPTDSAARRIDLLFNLMQQLDFMKAARVDVPELDYVLRHEDLTPAVFEPKDEEVKRFYRALHQAIWKNPERLTPIDTIRGNINTLIESNVDAYLHDIIGATEERRANYRNTAALRIASGVVGIIGQGLKPTPPESQSVILEQLTSAIDRDSIISNTWAVIEREIARISREQIDAIILEQFAQKWPLSTDIWQIIFLHDFDGADDRTRFLLHTGDGSTSYLSYFERLANMVTFPEPPPDVPTPPEDVSTPPEWKSRFILLDKIARFLSHLGFNAEELQKIYALPNTGDTEAALDLNTLPTATLPDDSTVPPASFERWKWMVRLKLLQSKYPKADKGVFDFITQAQSYSGTFTNFLTDEINAHTGWESAELEALCNGLSILEISSFQQLDAYERIEAARTWLHRQGSTDGNIGLWTTSYMQILSQTLETNAESRFGEDKKAWYKAFTPIMDKLRERKRDALVAYLLANSPMRGAVPLWQDTNDLYAHFLIDPEMSACMLSSRIVQAHNAVQLYMQRLLMGLEGDTRISDDSASETEYWKQWEWRKNYRVWEAARKVFLYPENWIEPDLRDNKSPFFEELENELLQDEVTQERVERAFRGYLAKLDEVARLDVRSLYEEEREGGQKILHVVARTYSESHIYYYRKRMPDRVWTAWEKVDLGIEGEHVFPVVHNGRLMIFWAVFKEEGGYWNLKIYWSQWRDGRWETPKNTGKDNSLKLQLIDIPDRAGIKRKIDPHSFTFRIKHNERGQIGMYVYSSFKAEDLGRFPNGETEKILDANGEIKEVPISETRYRLSEIGNIFYPIGKYIFDECKNELQREILMTSHSGITPNQSLFVNGMGFIAAVITTLGSLVIGDAPPRLMLDSQDLLLLEDSKLHINEYRRLSSTALRRFGGLRWGATIPLLNNYIFFSYKITGSSDQVFFKHDHPFIVEGDSRSYLISSDRLDFAHSSVSLYRTYRFESFYHPFLCQIIKRFNKGGIEDVLNPEATDAFMRRQLFREPRPVKFRDYSPNTTYVWRNTADPYEVYPYEHFDFSHHGAYALYNWELFFHTSLLVADRLSKNQKFEEARRWFHYIFDPTEVSGEDTAARFWKIKPFYEEARRWAGPAETLEEMMRRLATEAQDVENQVSAWRDDPFNPHLIARLRPVTYMKTTVIKYIENLVAWADSLFLRYTRESINEAIQLYILAAELLGKRPVRIPAIERADLDYSEVETRLDAFSNFLMELENGQPVELSAVRSRSDRTPLPPSLVFYFCIPDNDKLLGFWDTVADRLFKIRHCMNIEGIVQPLALFDPPIDPALLVRARAAGLDLATALSDVLDIRAPHYRFSYIIQKAQEFCSEVRGFGGALLAALEKKDAEELNLLRSRHEIAMLNLVRFVKDRQLEEAQEALEGIQASRKSAEKRLEHYTTKSAEYTNASEKKYLGNLNSARDYERIAEGFDLAASIAFAVPDFHVAGVASGTTYGGSHVGQLLNSTAQKIKALAGQFSFDAQMASITAGYERRREDWYLQADLAQKELDQIDKQILAAQIRVAIAELEISNHEKQLGYAEELEFFQKNKFTNKQLYSWQAAQLASLHYQAYQMAYDLAKKAQKAAQMELGIPASELNVIAFDNWDSQKKGLLTGDRLSRQLRRLETAYLDKNKREFELTKHISLQQLDPLELLHLRENGICNFSIPEALFDLDFPGHFYRRIRSVSISLPCVAGPYTTINATLRLHQSRVRKNPDGASYDAITDANFDFYRSGIQSIATSSAQNDGGLFELNFRDERYLPFEYSGAISEWTLELINDESDPEGAKRLRQFDYNTIADVIVHLRYTARENGSLKTAALSGLRERLNWLQISSAETGLHRLFSLRYDFSNEWHRHAQGGGDELTIMIEKRHFPYWVQLAQSIEITGFEIHGSEGDPVVYPQDGEPPLPTIAEGLPSAELSIPIESTEISALKDLWLILKYRLGS